MPASDLRDLATDLARALFVVSTTEPGDTPLETEIIVELLTRARMAGLLPEAIEHVAEKKRSNGSKRKGPAMPND